MSWNSYGLDRAAQKLVIDARSRDPQSLNQSYKMRIAVAYGLERFWGEHLRLQSRETTKSTYWKETWDTLVRVLDTAGIIIPNDTVDASNTRQIQTMSESLWTLDITDQRIALAVLTQLCDCVVWWTQRYKVGRLENDDDS